MVVREDIRQLLIFRDEPLKFLPYVRHFAQTCLQDYIASNYADGCAARILAELEIDATELSLRVDNFLKQCGGTGESLKVYQQLMLDRAKARLIGEYPSLLIDHYQVPISTQAELKVALCRKLGLESEDGCSQALNNQSVVSKVISVLFWLAVAVGLMGSAVLVVVYFRNRMRRQVNKELKMQVSTAVEHYYQLTESSQGK